MVDGFNSDTVHGKGNHNSAPKRVATPVGKRHSWCRSVEVELSPLRNLRTTTWFLRQPVVTNLGLQTAIWEPPLPSIANTRIRCRTLYTALMAKIGRLSQSRRHKLESHPRSLPRHPCSHTSEAATTTNGLNTRDEGCQHEPTIINIRVKIMAEKNDSRLPLGRTPQIVTGFARRSIDLGPPNPDLPPSRAWLGDICAPS
jgi:hypothetical protein